MRKGWIGTLVALFVLSMLAYPRYSGFLFGWPLSLLISIGLFLLYIIILPFFIKSTLDHQD